MYALLAMRMPAFTGTVVSQQPRAQIHGPRNGRSRWPSVDFAKGLVIGAIIVVVLWFLG